MDADRLLSEVIGDKLDSVLSAPSGLGLVLSGGVPTAQMPLSAEFVRFLTLEDVVLEESTVLGSVTPHLKKLRDSHHTLARLLAMGKRPVEVSAITGYCQSRISILKNDPAFAELVEFYRENTQAEYIDVHKRIAAVALDATAELHDRLIDDPESIKNSELIEIAKMTLDRSGFAPVTKTVNKNLNVSLSGEELLAMKEAVQKESLGNVKRIDRAALSANRIIDMDSVSPERSGGVCEDAGDDEEESLREEGVRVSKEGEDGAGTVEQFPSQPR